MFWIGVLFAAAVLTCLPNEGPRRQFATTLLSPIRRKNTRKGPPTEVSSRLSASALELLSIWDLCRCNDDNNVYSSNK